MTTVGTAVFSSPTGVRDPIHGYIRLEDEQGATQVPVIPRLIATRPMRRLRQVKQLGFASLQYSGADHSRFSHSLGTMHVMRKLLDRLDTKGPAILGLLAELQPHFVELGVTGNKDADKTKRLRIAKQHMLVAALLQDVGELPYFGSTSAVMRPSEDVYRAVSEFVSESVNLWDPKIVFTIQSLISVEISRIVAGMDLTCLAYLMTGQKWTSKKPGLHAAMQLLDGVVDADRIDYVSRDAHHTGVANLNADHVVDAVAGVDDLGAICTDPSPVATLLALRAHLYSTVYQSAENRFRVLTLSALLDDVNRSQKLSQAAVGRDSLAMNFEQFLGTDDRSVQDLLFKLDMSTAKADLSMRGQRAFDVHLDRDGEYGHRWYRSSDDEVAAAHEVQVPGEVFYEVFLEKDRSAAPTVRVKDVAGSDGLVALSEFNGPYSGAIANGRATIPMQGDVLVWEPAATGGFPANYLRARSDGSLGAALKKSMLRSREVSDPDTRAREGFDGPSIFISYCTEDFEIVRLIVDRLANLKQRYYLIADPYQGVGGTPGGNSRDGVHGTDAAIVVASAAYLRRYRDMPGGNIAKEILAMRDRRVEGPGAYPVVPLATIHHSDLLQGPWLTLGWAEPPFVGAPIKTNDVPTLDIALAAAIKAVREQSEAHRAKRP